jgi:hypothetical protein
MRRLLALGSLSLAAITGCAATAGQERVVVAVDAPAARTSSEVVEVTEVVQPLAPEAALSRPRLAQTVTLGQGTDASYTAAPTQQGPGTNGGPNVVVNNNITVVGGQPGYGGYGGYGYGYGGYGGAAPRDYGRGSGSTSRAGAWAPSGWEGAQRTAAPGRTPGVGGNWAPPANHGPRTMK